MNDKFTNTSDHDDEIIARKLSQTAEQTQASGQFAAELEERLRAAHPPRASWFQQASPVLRWVAVMALLALVLSWSIKSLVPAPQPAIQDTPVTPVITTHTPEAVVLPDESATPETQGESYDYRGGKLTLQQPLPQSPAKAHVYLLQKDAQASAEQARALADRFGIQGEMYTEPNYVFNTTNYVISDGMQSLSIYSDRYFSYAADMAKVRRMPNGMRSENAEANIHAFLVARGMDFPFEIRASDFFGAYSIRPLAPDSLPMQYESFTWPPMRVALDENGQVLSIDATLLDIDQVPVGEYDIISAQEALDKLRDDYAQGGKTEFMHSANNAPQEWYRTYPDNQPVTLSGYLFKKPALEAGKPPLLMIDGSALTGNTGGLEVLDDYTFLAASGQFSVENGIRKFNVSSWDRNVNEAYLQGTLSRQGDQVIITSDDGSGRQVPLVDPPADLPIGSLGPDSTLAVSGLILDNQFSWNYIQYFESMGGGGGGGGGGLGFYKLNLDGPPAAFPPTRAPQPTPSDIQTYGYTVQEGDTLTAIAQTFNTTVEELTRINNLTDFNIYIGQSIYVPVPEIPEKKVEDLRGYLRIAVRDNGDGTSTREYGLDVNMPEGGTALYTLEGPQLGELDAYNGLPILVTGILKDKLAVESYKIPYPDLHFQILRGTQKVQEVNGQNVVVFTTEDGKSYVEYMVTNNFPKVQALASETPQPPFEYTVVEGDTCASIAAAFAVSVQSIIDANSLPEDCVIVVGDILKIPSPASAGKPQAFTGVPGDLIEQEVLIIPDETYGDLPVAHIYQSALVQANGPAMESLANRIQSYDSPPDEPTLPGSPSLIIDRVELVYYVPNPYYQAASDPNYELRSPNLQPAWRFHGIYADGSELEVMIQALKQEFLLPEIAPGLSPG